MTVISAFIRRIVCRCCMLALVMAMPVAAFAADRDESSSIAKASNNSNYIPGSVTGVNLGNGVQNVKVDAFNICRYIDNNGSKDILVPFKSLAEWVGTTGVNAKGFLATSNNRSSFIKLDFCRQPRSVAGGNPVAVQFTGTNGVSNTDSVVGTPIDRLWSVAVSNGEPTPADAFAARLDIAGRRLDTTSAAAFDATRRESISRRYNMQRTDCYRGGPVLGTGSCNPNLGDRDPDGSCVTRAIPGTGSRM